MKTIVNRIKQTPGCVSLSDPTVKQLTGLCEVLRQRLDSLNAGNWQDRKVEADWHRGRSVLVGILAPLLDQCAKLGLISTVVFTKEGERFIGFSAFSARANGFIQLNCDWEAITLSGPAPTAKQLAKLAK